jgi:7-carboxy-7-deazaguanine synthase
VTYSVKEIFYTLQGEGANAGKAAVFCRFSGCNLWTGREEDRHRAICQFCDTNFFGMGQDGGKFESAAKLADAVDAKWNASDDTTRKLVVCTGGEPLLQLDAELVSEFHSRGFTVAVETNGTQNPPGGIDWICVSPKAGAELVIRKGNELKLVYPQPGAMPEQFSSLAFEHFFLQPMDGENAAANTRAAIEYCMSHPRWRLSIQTHKLVGIR